MQRRLPNRVILPPPVALPHVKGDNSSERLTFRLGSASLDALKEACQLTSMSESQFIRWATLSAAGAIAEWIRRGYAGEAVFTGSTSIILESKKDG